MFQKISFVLLAVLLGIAMAWIRPAQPTQVDQPKTAPAFAERQLLDNEAIPLENSIHNSRKCKYGNITLRYGNPKIVLRLPVSLLTLVSLSLLAAGS